MSNELYHYGVLGMKWGVRRYQPYGSGGYNPKNKRTTRAEKKQAKQIRNKIINAKIDYEDEFDNTKEGKKLRKAYSDIIDEMENSIYNDPDEWWDKNSDRFIRIEEAYLKPQAKYCANKLLKNHSHSDIYYYLRESNYKVTEDMDADQYRNILINMWKNNRYD